MRLVPVSEIWPGMLVAQDVIDDRGQVLLHKNVPLTHEYIRALESKGFTRIYVKEPDEPAGVELEEDLSPLVRVRAQVALRNAFDRIAREIGPIRAESAREVAKTFESDRVSALMGRNGPLTQVIEVVSQIIDSVLSHSVLAGLTSIKTADSYLFDHSLDVCVVSVMIAHTVGLSSDWLRQIAAGSLLHDIGKLFLDPSITGDRAIAQHTRLGYELLRASEQRDILTPHVAFEHHERPDGTGLPRGIQAGNRVQRDRTQQPPIPTVLGEIAAVANAYDHLLSGDGKTPGLPPDEALRALRAGAGTAFNRELVTALLRVAPVYPKGSEVIVRGEKYYRYRGVVIEINPAHLDLPVIMLLRDGTGNAISPITIDLQEEQDIVIQSRL